MITLLASLLGCTQTPAAADGTPDVRSCDPLALHTIRLASTRSGSVIEDHWLPLVVEAELARTPGLVPRLEPLQALPGMRWDTTDHEVDLTFANGVATAHICTDGFCVDRDVAIDPVVPESSAAQLAGTIAAELGHGDVPRASVHAPQDDYTRLVAARAAAQARGDRQTERDSLARALRLQPMLAPLQWLVLRSQEDIEDRLPALQRLARERGEPLDLAALADAYDRTDQPTRAAEIWGQLVRVHAHDGRWRLPAARSAVRVGDSSLALEALDGLPVGPEVAELRVAVADLGDGAGPALLREWARLAPDDPTPVERLIDASLADGRIEGALAWTGELEKRGAGEAAATLRAAAEANLGGDRTPLDALQESLRDHESALQEARLYLADLAHAQNSWALARHEDPYHRCGDEELEKVEQARRLGQRTRTAVKDALSAAAQLHAIAHAADVRPLLDDERRTRIDEVLAGSDELPERYRAAVRIQEEQLEPWSRRCR